mmetsp:Transcript_133039/g.284391  ORF Transcript_133039/g.284391 Transcript_133039/m.284391 type:complete len:708 (-) Transcript_133039:2-2125(-)
MVALFPRLEADGIRALVGRPSVWVHRPQERDHIDPLRARGPCTATQDGDMLGTMLGGGAQVLKGEGAGTDNDDALTPKLQGQDLVCIAIDNIAPEMLLSWIDDITTLPDTAVDVEAHGLAVSLEFLSGLHVFRIHHERPIIQLGGLRHLDIAMVLPIHRCGRHREDVTEDVMRGRVILVGTRGRAYLIDNAISDLRGVYAGELVRIKIPDTPDIGSLLQADDVLAELGEGLGLVDARQAATNNNAIDLFRHGLICRADIRLHFLRILRELVLLQGFCDEVEKRLLGPASEAVTLGGQDLTVDVVLERDVLEGARCGVRLPFLHRGGCDKGIGIVPDRNHWNDHGPLRFLAAEFVGAHNLEIIDYDSALYVADVVAIRDARLFTPCVRKRHRELKGQVSNIINSELVEIRRKAESLEPLELVRRSVLLLELVRCRTTGHHECNGQVRRVVILEPLQHLIGNNGAHAVTIPDGVRGVCKRQNLAHDLVDHLVEIRPTLPTDDPDVAGVARSEIHPSFRVEGMLVPELACEKQDAKAGWMLRHRPKVREHLSNCHAASVLPRVGPFVAEPRTLNPPHVVRGIPKRVREGRVFVRCPRPGSDHGIHGIPFPLVLIQPLACGGAVLSPRFQLVALMHDGRRCGSHGHDALHHILHGFRKIADDPLGVVRKVKFRYLPPEAWDNRGVDNLDNRHRSCSSAHVQESSLRLSALP